MAFLPAIRARAYPYDDAPSQDSNEVSHGAARKRRLQIGVVEDVDYDVYYENEATGVANRSTRAMDEHVLARMRDDIRRANARQANPDSAMPDRPVEDEQNLRQALQEYNAHMNELYQEALKLPPVAPATETSENMSDGRPRQGKNQSAQGSPAPKQPPVSARSPQPTSTGVPRRSVSHGHRTRSKSRNARGAPARSRAGPYGGNGKRSKSGRGTSRSSQLPSRRDSFRNERRSHRSNNEAAPVEYDSAEIDDFIRREQQKSGRYSEAQDIQQSTDSETERREKLRRAQELAQRLREDAAVDDSADWD